MATGGEIRDDYAMLFAHGTVRGIPGHLEYDLLGGAPAPACIVPELFGVDVLETCEITTKVDPRPWIDRFVETFEMAAPETAVIRSVTLLHTRFDEEYDWGRSIDLLRHPRRVPTPRSAFVKEWYRNDHRNGIVTTESRVAELALFENANLAKKLQVFAWTVEQVDNEQLHDWHYGCATHYAFLLQVVDM